MKIYYDKDADLKNLKGKKIAIIGYGSQGHAQAQNLRDSGLDVIVSQRKGGENYELALRHGFKPITANEAARQADLIQILTQDHIQAKLYEEDVKPHLGRESPSCSLTGSTFIMARSSLRKISMW